MITSWDQGVDWARFSSLSAPVISEPSVTIAEETPYQDLRERKKWLEAMQPIFDDSSMIAGDTAKQMRRVYKACDNVNHNIYAYQNTASRTGSDWITRQVRGRGNTTGSRPRTWRSIANWRHDLELVVTIAQWRLRFQGRRNSEGQRRPVVALV